MPKLAFENPEGDLFRLSDGMIEEGLAATRESDRKRMILPIHRMQEAEVQRLINFLQPGTYIRPHKHPLDHASESIILLKGSIRFFTFDDDGAVLTDQVVLSTPIPGVLDIEPNVWHSFLVLEEDTILFECKKGPYDVKTDKEFAEWAPYEGHQTVENWLKKLNT